jgi:hypothetical protein
MMIGTDNKHDDHRRGEDRLPLKGKQHDERRQQRNNRHG